MVGLEVVFEDEDLDRLEIDPEFTAGWDRAVIRGFRKVMQAIRSAVDERDFYAAKGLHFEKLEPPREHQRSFRINKKWRLIVELRTHAGKKQIAIIEIVDYH